jgi:cyanate permease
MPDARWLALGVLTLARISMGFQFQSVASVAIDLRGSFGLNYADIGLLIGLYMSPGLVLALPGGMLGQRFGDKRMVVLGLVLMTLGALLMSFADGWWGLAVGRLLSGVGGVLLNVLMAKMITDWFAGREIVVAMGIFVNSFPLGIGLALISLSRLVGAAGWAGAMQATAIVSLAALLLMVLAYRRHSNDRNSKAATKFVLSISVQEAFMVSLVGIIWGLLNGVVGIYLGFSPIFLGSRGLDAAEAGFWVGLASWLAVASGIAGGAVVQRWGRENLVFASSIGLSAVCYAAVPVVRDAVPPLLAVAVLLSMPAALILALPGRLLRPQARGTGVGIFYTWVYLGQATLPALAGKLQDFTGSLAASQYFATALVLAMLIVFVALRVLQREPQPGNPTPTVRPG